jgi:citrate synthase
MGFGHRVYKFDPRAKIIKKAADEVLYFRVDDPILYCKKIRRICTC